MKQGLFDWFGFATAPHRRLRLTVTGLWWLLAGMLATNDHPSYTLAVFFFIFPAFAWKDWEGKHGHRGWTLNYLLVFIIFSTFCLITFGWMTIWNGRP
jgi:hypothetical protein